MMQSLGFAIAASLTFLVFGAGMIYVTWIRPSSRFRRIFCARWRLFGRTASKFGAATQSFTLLAMGLGTLLSVFDAPFKKYAFAPLLVGIVFTGIARLGDLRDDEA